MRRGPCHQPALAHACPALPCMHQEHILEYQMENYQENKVSVLCHQRNTLTLFS